MDLLIIRHAIAVDRVRFSRTGRPDAERPLTKDGEKKFRRAVKGLRRAVPRVDRLATSPYRRAAQTCAIAAKSYRGAGVVTLPSLAQRGDDRATIRWLAAQKPNAVVALVGHEPDLGRLTSKLVGSRASPVIYKKGGVALVTFEGRARAGAGKIRFALSPGLLKRLR
jgi:phosphohistidine phosphatase